MTTLTTPTRPRSYTKDLHVMVDQVTLKALDELRARYAARGVATSRSSMARLAISLALDQTVT